MLQKCAFIKVWRHLPPGMQHLPKFFVWMESSNWCEISLVSGYMHWDKTVQTCGILKLVSLLCAPYSPLIWYNLKNNKDSPIKLYRQAFLVITLFSVKFWENLWHWCITPAWSLENIWLSSTRGGRGRPPEAVCPLKTFVSPWNLIRKQ